tara:strand:+ start:969 stop:1178 length:210 start_codon:yes stop_codon:yes gene_type:complete
VGKVRWDSPSNQMPKVKPKGKQEYPDPKNLKNPVHKGTKDLRNIKPPVFKQEKQGALLYVKNKSPKKKT